MPVSLPDTTTDLDDRNYGTSFPRVVPLSYSVPVFALALTGVVIGSPMYIRRADTSKPHTKHIYESSDIVPDTLVP